MAVGRGLECVAVTFLNGWVLIEPEGVEDEEQLKAWIERATKVVKSLPAN